MRLLQGIENAVAQHRLVGINHAHRSIVHIVVDAGGGGMHQRGEGKHNQHHQHGVAKQAAQFFGAEREDVFDASHS